MFQEGCLYLNFIKVRGTGSISNKSPVFEKNNANSELNTVVEISNTSLDIHKKSSIFNLPKNEVCINNKKLFEKFLIIGVNKSDIIGKNEENLSVLFLQPRVLMEYPQDKEENSWSRVVQDFAFPFEVEVEQISIERIKKCLNYYILKYFKRDLF